jgi:hypothetical protein
MPSVNYAEFRKQAHYAECHFAECRYAKCRDSTTGPSKLASLSQAGLSSIV